MEGVKKFERENRYIVIKRSDLKKVPVNYRSTMITPMFNLLPHLPRRECVVVESDWPEYEIVWAMIEHRMGGNPVPDFDRIKAENEALQLLLNNRDDLDDQLTSLEQRRYAEQQAREAAERRVEELAGLLRQSDDFMYIMTGHDSHARLVHQYGKEWWTPVNELRGKICTALSNQSAPADKGHGGPVGVIVEFGFGLKEVSWTNGKMPDLGTKLYAERPAPVAVVMPEHRDSDLRSPVYGYARGWNACLDEFARLNPIKQ